MPTPIAAATSPKPRLRLVPLRSGRRRTVSISASGSQEHPSCEYEDRTEGERDEVERGGPGADEGGADEHAERDPGEPGDDDPPPAGPRVEPYCERDREPAAEDADEVPHEGLQRSVVREDAYHHERGQRDGVDRCNP